MKVILSKDIPALGKKDEIKEVNDGYARNYLVPSGLARPATDGLLAELERANAVHHARSLKIKSESQELADRVRDAHLVFSMKVGERGKTFGSVGSAKIQEALKRKHIVVEKEWILLDDPIKEVGDRMIKIRLPRSVECELKITIKSES